MLRKHEFTSNGRAKGLEVMDEKSFAGRPRPCRMHFLLHSIQAVLIRGLLVGQVQGVSCHIQHHTSPHVNVQGGVSRLAELSSGLVVSPAFLLKYSILLGYVIVQFGRRRLSSDFLSVQYFLLTLSDPTYVKRACKSAQEATGCFTNPKRKGIAARLPLLRGFTLTHPVRVYGSFACVKRHILYKG